MKTLLRLCCVSLLALSAPLPAQDNPLGLEPVTLDQAGIAAVNRAGARGSMLFWYDRAAWMTTDAMREDLDDPAGAGVAGWVVIPDEGGLRVTYWKRDGDGFAGVYSALFSGSDVSQRQVLEGAAAALSPQQLQMVNAQMAVTDRLANGAEGFFRCSQSALNAVTLPPEVEGGPVLFYLLTPQTSDDAVPAGGHFLFEVQDGRVSSERGFTNSCLDLQTSAPGQEEPPVYIGVTHFLDPYPTEIHVFTALAARIPLLVTTTQNRWMWSVSLEQGRPQIYLAGALPEDD